MAGRAGWEGHPEGGRGRQYDIQPQRHQGNTVQHYGIFTTFLFFRSQITKRFKKQKTQFENLILFVFLSKLIYVFYQVSADLKMARSLVRLAEIQATLQEQRILLLRQQMTDMERLETRWGARALQSHQSHQSHRDNTDSTEGPSSDLSSQDLPPPDSSHCPPTSSLSSSERVSM